MAGDPDGGSAKARRRDSPRRARREAGASIATVDGRSVADALECGDSVPILQRMIQISESAQSHFRRLLEQQGSDMVGIRLSALRAGTPAADARLEFCEQVDLAGDEWALDCEGFTLFVAADSVPYFDAAEIDYLSSATGGQLSIRAPRIKGDVPGAGSSIVDRVRYVIESEINPQIASHNGRVSLEEVTSEGVVVLRFGGGCHGCGNADLTLKHGIEKTLRERVPEITGVRDATDHSSGSNPYIRRG
jgi:Fe/S biogenesis protein NfuA